MKKLIALILAMLFMGVGIASATDLTITGSYYARGTYIDNWDGLGNDVETYGQYDHELSFDTKWQIDDTTQVFARFEVRDATWGVASNPLEGTVPGTVGDTYDDNIVVEQVWGTHTFNYGGNIKVGLMAAGAWGTDFGNTGTEAYRLFYTQPTSFATLIGIIEKPHGGETQILDKDTDKYMLGAIAKWGSVNVLPLFVYANIDSADTDKMSLQLSLNGASGNLGWEADMLWNSTSAPTGMPDYDLWGAYGKIWGQFDAFKIGGLIAYGSYESDVHKGFNFGDDFTAGGALLMGDDVFNGADALEAMTLFALTGSYAASDVLSFGLYLGYADSNVDNPASFWDGADIWEISANMAYKITDNVTYDIYAGTAQVNPGDVDPSYDPDAAVEIFHRLSFSF